MAQPFSNEWITCWRFFLASTLQVTCSQWMPLDNKSISEEIDLQAKSVKKQEQRCLTLPIAVHVAGTIWYAQIMIFKG